jgi:putative aldouronate transport system substrate-binding protein
MRRTNVTSRRDFLRTAALGSGTLLLAACGAAPDTATTPSSAASTAVGASASAQGEASTAATLGSLNPQIIPAPKTYSPVLEITQTPPFFSTKFKPGESIDNNVFSRWLEEQLGVRYKYAWESSDQDEQRWTQAMASGDLPEFLSCMTGSNFYRLRDAGRLENIKEIWERTASDLVKQKFEYPTGVIWQRVMDGNNLWALANSNPTAANDMTLYIRKDWFDQAGLKPPTTLDEMYTAGKTLIDRGIAKIGLAIASDEWGMIQWQGSADPIFGAYGVMPTYWMKGADGKLVYGSIQPQTKEVLGLLRQWYQDGIIEREFFTVGPGGDQGVISRVVGGQAAMIFAPWWFATTTPDAVKKNDPQAEIVAVEIPAGPDGTRGRAGTSPLNRVAGFLKGTDPAKIEAVINHLNWNVERFTRQWETRDYNTSSASVDGLGRVLFEGYDYVIENDIVKPGGFNTSVYEGGAGAPNWQFPSVLAEFNAQVAELSNKDQAELNPFERSQVSDPAQVLAGQVYNDVFRTNQYAIMNAYLGPQTPTMLTSEVNLRKREAEVFARIVSNQEPLEAFDAFVAEWRAGGGDKMTEEVNAELAS